MRHDCIFRDQGAGSHHGIFTDDRAVHDDGAHTNQHSILDRTAVQNHFVADCHIVADDQRVCIMGHMQHAEVLDVGAISDSNVVHVPSNDSMEPDAAVLSHDDVADDDAGFLDEAGRGDRGREALECSNHRRTIGQLDPEPQGRT